MAERGWLNANNYIAYPLVDRADRTFSGGGELPRSGLSDAGFMLGPDSGFVPVTNEVHLYAVHRDAVRLLFDFRSDAVNMSAYRWLFEVTDDVDDYATITAVPETISLGIPGASRGEGFIALGNLDALRALSVGSHVLTTPLPVEPALVQSLANTFAQSLSIANDARRCPEANCGSSLSSEEAESDNDSFPFVKNLSGVLRFRDGYNMTIEVSETANTITFNARRGYGMGEPCEDTVIDEGGFRRSEECVNCDGFVKSFNGVAMGKNVRLACGPGVTVAPDAANHKISVTVEINRACEQ